MKQLVISKIEVSRDGIKWLECTLTRDDDFESHPDTITFLGDQYDKTSWSVAGIVCYQTSRRLR
jgi:hypothetical protein